MTDKTPAAVEGLLSDRRIHTTLSGLRHLADKVKTLNRRETRLVYEHLDEWCRDPATRSDEKPFIADLARIFKKQLKRF